MSWLTQLRRLLNLEPVAGSASPPPASDSSKQALYTEASNLLKQQDYARAIKLFERMLKFYPTSTRAHRGRALCRIGLGDYLGAKADIENWIVYQRQRGEDDADAYFHLGECYIALGAPASDKQAMRDALAINPMHTRAQQALRSL